MDNPHDEVPSPKESVQEWREQILNRVLYGLAFFGLFTLLVGVKAHH